MGGGSESSRREGGGTKCIRNQRSNSQFNFDPPDGVKNILLGRFPRRCCSSFHLEMLVSRGRGIFFSFFIEKERMKIEKHVYTYREYWFD